MSTETINIVGSSNSPEWIKAADAEHEVVNLSNYLGGGVIYAVSEEEPPFEAVSSTGSVCIQNAGAAVWVYVTNASRVSVVRGNALITNF